MLILCFQNKFQKIWAHPRPDPIRKDCVKSHPVRGWTPLVSSCTRGPRRTCVGKRGSFGILAHGPQSCYAAVAGPTCARCGRHSEVTTSWRFTNMFSFMSQRLSWIFRPPRQPWLWRSQTLLGVYLTLLKNCSPTLLTKVTRVCNAVLAALNDVQLVYMYNMMIWYLFICSWHNSYSHSRARERISFKLCLLVYKALHSLAPWYLNEMCIKFPLFPTFLLSVPLLVVIWSYPEQGYDSATGHFVWLVRSPGTVHHLTFVWHLHYQRSKTCSRHICSLVPPSLTNCFQQRTLYGALVVTLAMLLRLYIYIYIYNYYYYSIEQWQ